ncbi:Glycineserine hydroxymethyltransferase [Aspergillus affinis]|uniref:Glycineserine hydroxymethyltransferase n=1 Tax=Aspergillus affinis TaxID=1070780 RepID=UPI0022FEC563|nr:Glycineserine hydroxymethyltransferase [Aspergillus affinis]KAI9034934.1 Glycineserine hydroxymethyltransferase [Aspergillus affinis]
MQLQDTADQIPRRTFVISTSVLLGLALVAVTARFLIRFRVQRQLPNIDDCCLTLAFALLLIGFGFLHEQILDRMYLIASLQRQAGEKVIPGPEWMQLSSEFHKWVTICSIITWCSIMMVKFSFLFFFKRLIDSILHWWIYWIFVTLYNVGNLGYGVAIYYTGCPFFFDPRGLQCVFGPYKKLFVTELIAQMVLDIIGDILILTIPIAVTWTVRVSWKQKIILICSLCLTIIMASISIIRVSLFIYQGVVDVIWGLFWQFLAAEVGVFLAAAAAFRSFFVTRKNSKNTTPPYSIKRFVKKSITGTYRPRGLHSLHSSSYRDSRIDLEDMANDSTDMNGPYNSHRGQDSRAEVPREQNPGMMPQDRRHALPLCPSRVRTKDSTKMGATHSVISMD